MNWDAISSIAELIGAAAVVVSLLYLAIQVRSGTQELQTTTRGSAIHALLEWNYYMMSDPELGWIFQTGCRDFMSLDEKERSRLIHVMYSFFKMFENVYLHHLDGSVDQDVWEFNHPMLLAYATQPGARYYLEHRERIFDPRFWRFLQENASTDVPAGHVVGKLGD